MRQVQGMLASDEREDLGVNTGEELVVVDIAVGDTEKLETLNFFKENVCNYHTLINRPSNVRLCSLWMNRSFINAAP